MTNDFTIPTILRGQIIKQGPQSYYVRGQYVVSRHRNGSWFWYDIYDRRNKDENLGDATAAFESVAAHVSK